MGEHEWLGQVSTAHGAPGNGIQKFGAFAAVLVYLDEQFQEDLAREHCFHFLAREGADLFQRTAFSSDDNSLLTWPLDADGLHNASQLASLLPLLAYDGASVRHFLSCLAQPF